MGMDLPLQNVPVSVKCILPTRAGVLKPGTIRPGIPTSIADPNLGTLNIAVFLEAGDVQGGSNGQVFFATAVPFTDGDVTPNATGRYFDPRY
jgi:hypothetical protein